MAHLIVGAPATGSAFFNRKNELKHIWSRINDSNLLLAAPRRFGKTSIFLNMVENPAPGFSVYFVDLQGYGAPEDLVTGITSILMEDAATRAKIARFVKKSPSRFLNAIKKHIDEFSVADFKISFREEMGRDWRSLAGELLEATKTFDKKVVFILDELPLLIKRMLSAGTGETEQFLYWLRSIRTSRDFQNVRFIIGGSIGIESILNKAQAAAAINDLERFQIGAFSREDAKIFVEELFDNQRLPKDGRTIEEVLNVIDVHIPYFLQILISALSQEFVNRKLDRIDPDMVNKVYTSKVLGVECRTYFEHYFQRLCMYYDRTEERAAKELLKSLSILGKMNQAELYNIFLAAVADEVENPRETFNYLLADLENDFYIEYDEQTQTYRFKTRVLRDWWKKYYGFLS